jgi:hypothetical protein
LIYRLQSTVQNSESANQLAETLQGEPIRQETDPAQSLSLVVHS